MKIEFDPGIKIECLVCKRKSKITAKGKVPRGWKFSLSCFLCPQHKKETIRASKKKTTKRKLKRAKKNLKRRR